MFNVRTSDDLARQCVDPPFVSSCDGLIGVAGFIVVPAGLRQDEMDA